MWLRSLRRVVVSSTSSSSPSSPSSSFPRVWSRHGLTSRSLTTTLCHKNNNYGVGLGSDLLRRRGYCSRTNPDPKTENTEGPKLSIAAESLNKMYEDVEYIRRIRDPLNEELQKLKIVQGFIHSRAKIHLTKELSKLGYSAALLPHEVKQLEEMLFNMNELEALEDIKSVAEEFNEKAFREDKISYNERTLSIKAPCCGGVRKHWECKSTKIVKDWQKDWIALRQDEAVYGVLWADVALYHEGHELKYEEPDEVEVDHDRMTLFEETFGKAKRQFWHQHLLDFLRDDNQEYMNLPSYLTPAEKNEIQQFAEQAGSLKFFNASDKPNSCAMLMKVDNPEIIVKGVTLIKITSPGETKKLSQGKLKQMEKMGIEYAEVIVDPSFYEGFTSWDITQPLPVARTSYKWVCEECKNETQRKLNFVKLGAVVDVYQKEHLHRKAFSILQHVQDKTFYLVEQTGIARNFNDRVLQADKTVVIARAQKSLDDIKAILEKRVDSVVKEPAMQTEIKISWPGKTLEELIPSEVLEDYEIDEKSSLKDIYRLIDFNVDISNYWDGNAWRIFKREAK